MKREKRSPVELVGHTVKLVDVESYDGYPDEFKEVVLQLDDGRVFEFSSCDCCGGGAFFELAERRNPV